MTTQGAAPETARPSNYRIDDGPVLLETMSRGFETARTKCPEAVEEIHSFNIPLRGLVNNAGTSCAGAIEDLPMSAIRNRLRVESLRSASPDAIVASKPAARKRPSRQRRFG